MLRGIAIILVICRHWNVNTFLGHAGWMGVDLFFVISGFLISGLLFSEYEKHGRIRPWRFVVRRGFKIYPLFYFLVALGLFIYFVADKAFFPYAITYKNALAELFFIQNYYSGVYLHTWSLAIEEHFYLLLVVCFFLLIRSRPLTHITTLYFILGAMVVIAALRVFLCYINQFGIYFTTHTRIDSLLAGVAVCYTYRYKKEWFRIFATKARYLILTAAILCLSIFGFFEPNNLFTQSTGFTIIYCASAALLVLVLTSKSAQNGLFRVPAFIGYYSYAIYLTHIPVLYTFFYFGIVESTGPVNVFHFFLYALSCIAAGVILSELIEQPLLRLRDTYFPSNA